MKNIFIILILVLTNNLYAQPSRDYKRDLLWPIGKNSAAHPINPTAGNMLLDFSQDTMSAYFHYLSANYFETTSSICDTSGNLLFYTNGIYVYDSTNTMMMGWDTLNPGYQAYQWRNNGYRLPQGVLTLPQPANSQYYYLFHMNYNYDQNLATTRGYNFYYSVIDIYGNGGLGEITDLHHLILADSFEVGNITACRHGNGRDWWVVVPHAFSNKYTYLLLDSIGLHYRGQQDFGGTRDTQLGQSVFTPDGTKYCKFGAESIFDPYPLFVYDFDRCSGLLSNEHIVFLTDTAGLLGAAISPNSRFIYLNLQEKIVQYDLQANPIENSRITVGLTNGLSDTLGGIPQSVSFYLSQLGPDGKIYITGIGPNRWIHVINEPNEAGIASNVTPLRLPCVNNNGCIANFPNFRLGALDGSTCDTLGIDTWEGPVAVSHPVTSPSIQGVFAYPSPASASTTIAMSRALPQDGRMEVHDMNGRLIEAHALQRATIGYGLNTSAWTNGIYVATVWCGGAIWGATQIVIEH